jgi:hypothetical protein
MSGCQAGSWAEYVHSVMAYARTGRSQTSKYNRRFRDSDQAGIDLSFYKDSEARQNSTHDHGLEPAEQNYGLFKSFYASRV